MTRTNDVKFEMESKNNDSSNQILEISSDTGSEHDPEESTGGFNIRRFTSNDH